MATFCLIHGNWHDGSSWRWLLGPLRARGHEAVTPDLPIDDPRAGWDERIEPVLNALEGIDRPVPIVAHSGSSGYGALVAARLDGSLLVYLCPRLNPFSPPPDAPEVFRPGFPFPPRRPDGANVWEREAAITAIYSRLSPEAAEELADRLRPTAPPAGEFPLQGHPDVATALIYASEDELFKPDWERFMAREFLGVEPIEIRGGHFPMVEDPEGLADLLDRLAHEHARSRAARVGSPSINLGSMLDHVGINVSDYDRSRAFYEQALAPLGYSLLMEPIANTGGFGSEGKPWFWISAERRPVTENVHVAFTTQDRATVDAFHAAALDAGGTDNGAPGVREIYHPSYYGAYVLDPDGNNVEAVCHKPE